MSAKRNTTGLYPIHQRRCASRESERPCDCTPTWQAWVPARRPGDKALRKNFKTKAEARAWRQDAVVAVRKGTMRAPSATTLEQAAEHLLTGMRDGTIRDRSGGPYKPATIRGYERSLKLRLVPEFGHVRLSSLRRNDVQDFIDRMLADGLSASTVKNTLDPLRVIFRRAIRRDEVSVDPTAALDIPADRGRRDRFATPAEAVRLIAALPGEERALWATAFYTGMRRGELRELRWSDVNLAEGVIRVERGLDDSGEVIRTKTTAGERDVPILSALKHDLVEHGLATGRTGDDLVFGRTATAPFIPSTVRSRALKAWKAANDKVLGEAQERGEEVDAALLLAPIALHEARHSAASLLRAAGVDFKMISAIIGHSSVVITFDRYTHVSAEDLRAAAKQVDGFLATASS